MPQQKKIDTCKPTIILIVGNISAGKTTLSDSLSHMSGATRLSSDDIFKVHKGDPFPELLRRVETTIAYGDSCIVDTTGSSFALRESIERHRDIGTQVFVVRLECSLNVQNTRDDIRLDRKSLGESFWKQSVIDSQMVRADFVLKTNDLDPKSVLESVLEKMPPACGFVTRPKVVIAPEKKTKKRFFWERRT